MDATESTATTILAGAKRSSGGSSSRSASITVVVPTLNEAANLPHVLPLIPDFVDEVVLVDGHSVDSTIAVARAIRPDIRVVLQSGRGKGNALACGFAAASGDIIVAMDADGSTDPAEIPRFVETLFAGSDYAKGTRYGRDGRSHDVTLVRNVGNWGLAIAVNMLFRTRYTDVTYGYNAFWRDCLQHLSVDCDGFEVETLMTVRVARAGLAMTEVPCVEHKRIHGESKLHAARDGLRILRMIVRERARQHRNERALEGWRPPFRELAQGEGIPVVYKRLESGSRHEAHTHGSAARSELSPSVGVASP